MTPADALLLADDLQARADHFGDRAGEGVHLGRAASAIRDLATQVETLTPAPIDATSPVTEDATEPEHKARRKHHA